MDPNALAGMVFTLILTGMIGGFILLIPIARRLGVLLEQKVKPAALPDAQQAQELAALRQQVESMQRSLKQLTERQEFTEQLIGDQQRKALDAGR